MRPNTKQSIVWGLYVLGIPTLITPFVGAGLAHHWRKEADARDRMQHDWQLRLFWDTAMAWGVCFVLSGIALFLHVRSGAPVSVGSPTLFTMGMMVAVLAQICFTLVSLWHLVEGVLVAGRRGHPA
ncbi:hypothetical protein [Antarctobacter jejuensis]|uniref:hypothetical protein n=1 Tax=Antarctobacter jejuensis TaxID=1439938 RepID=UPI003FD30236